MQHVTSSVRVLLVVILAMTFPVAGALPQSGRGRPKVPQPSSTTSNPNPVSVPAATAVIKQEQAGTTSRFVLHNGITVVINEQHASPIVAAVACFKAAPLDDEWGVNGSATLIKRLILNGNAQIQLRALGAYQEAVASRGFDSYPLIVSPGKLKEALTIQADSLQNPQLDDDAIRREIPRIMAEARLGGGRVHRLPASGAFTNRTVTSEKSELAVSRLRTFDDPASYSMARLIDIAFTSASSNSFNVDALRSITREQLLELYRSRYRPENLIVSIAGDVPTFDTLVLIQQLYGGFGEPAQAIDRSSRVGEPAKRPTASAQKPRKDALPAERSEPLKPNQSPESKPAAVAQDKLRYAADRGDITQSIVNVGFHVPGAESGDSAALDVLTVLLGQGRASLLGRSLIDGQMIANRIEAGYLARQKTGLLTIQIWPAVDSASIDKAEAALFKVLDSVRRETPSEGQLVRAKSVIEKRFLDDTGTYLGRATALALAEADGSGWKSALDYRARIRAVSAADVQRIAAAHLTLANTSIHEYEPLSAAARTFDSDTFTKTVMSWAPGFAQPVDNASVRSAEPAASLAPVPQGAERPAEQRALMESVQPLPIKDFSTLNGPKAFVREDHSQPKVEIAILFQGGRVIEDISTSGTTELMLRSILYGTPRRTFLQVTDELEQLGADVRIVAEPDFFGFIVSVLSRNADRAVKLVREEIEEPAFRDDDIARARLGQIASIREAHDLSFLRSRELLLQALFPGHPYSLPPHGREDVVTALTGEKVRDWHSRVIKRQLPIAIIVGDTNGSALVSAQIAEGFKRRAIDSAIQVKVPDIAKAAEKIEQRRSEHTTVAIGVAGPKGDSNDLAVLQLIEAAMNLEGGRFLLELGDKQGLILTAALVDEEMFVTGVLWAWAMTAPENEQRARAALIAQLEGLSRNGMTANELASARVLAASSQLALLQTQTQHALQYAPAIFYRRQVTDVDNAGEHLSKVSSDDVKRVASTYFKAATASSGVVRGAASQPQAPSAPKQD